MVVLAQWIEEKEPDVVAENRVWDFLGDAPDRVRQTTVQVADCDREITVRLYDSRRGPSLAQREHPCCRVLRPGPAGTPALRYLISYT
jgi:hypothetical protein